MAKEGIIWQIPLWCCSKLSWCRMGVGSSNNFVLFAQDQPSAKLPRKER